MSDFRHSIYLLRQILDERVSFLRPLLYPEITHLTPSSGIGRQFAKRLAEITKSTPNHLFYQRVLDACPQVAQLTIDLRPSRKSRTGLWQEELALEVDYIWWSCAGATIAYVPVLDIEVVVNRPFDEKVISRIRTEIANGLIRNNHLKSLRSLLWLDRFKSISVEIEQIDVRLLSPKQVELLKETEDDNLKTLKKVASRIDHRGVPAAFAVDRQIEKLVELLTLPKRKSVLLVGPPGVGKTSYIQELASRKRAHGLGNVEFWETGGSRIVAGMSGFGQWQERCEQMIAALQKKDALLSLGNLVELIEVGKASGQKQGIGSFLRSYIDRGTLWAVAECTQEQLSVIEKKDPHLLRSFHEYKIEKPNETHTIQILREVVGHSIGKRATVTHDALCRIAQLHGRFARYSAFPGLPIRFLRNLMNESPRGSTIDADDVIKRFSQESGLPYFLISEDEPLNLAETRDWFSQRVVGQPFPVGLVTDLLAAVKANLTPAGRPIASYLFIGPTGVGKTEMAKTIAEFMFGDASRMIRFDMSEFADRSSIERLTGDFANQDGMLTSKVRQHPFSVVLFDEFEKADAAFFDLLLQILGEGRLTDANGRVTDFSTSIIIMTSNLGAESFRDQRMGFSGKETQETVFEQHFLREVQQFLRPELFNRIDRVVPFLPLSAETVRRIVSREIDKLAAREGIWFRGVDLQLDDEAIDLIAKNSNDAKFGARPIQRFIHDHLVVDLADQLNRFGAASKILATVTAASQRTLKINVRGVQQAVSEKKSLQPIEQLQDERRRMQKLTASGMANRIRNEYYRKKRAFERQWKPKKKNPRKHQTLDWKSQTDLNRYERMMERLDEVRRNVFQFEDELMLKYFQKQKIAGGELVENVKQLRKQIDDVLFEMFLFDSKGSDQVTLLVISRHREHLFRLIRAYRQIGQQRGYAQNDYLLRKHDPKRTDQQDKPTFRLKGAKRNDEEPKVMSDVFRTEVLDEVMLNAPSDLLGLGIQFKGTAAYPFLSHERGRHLFQQNSLTRTVLIEAVGGLLINHDLHPQIDQLGHFEDRQIRRVYIQNEPVCRIRDEFTGPIDYDPDQFSETVSRCVDQNLRTHLNRILTS